MDAAGCDPPEGSWAEPSGEPSLPWCANAPNDPSGLHCAQCWQRSSPLILLREERRLQDEVTQLRWEVKSQHSVPSCVPLILTSQLDTREQAWKMRRPSLAHAQSRDGQTGNSSNRTKVWENQSRLLDLPTIWHVKWFISYTKYFKAVPAVFILHHLLLLSTIFTQQNKLWDSMFILHGTTSN